MKIDESHIGKRVRVIEAHGKYSHVVSETGLLLEIDNYYPSGGYGVFHVYLSKPFSKKIIAMNVELIDDKPEFDVEALKEYVTKEINECDRYFTSCTESWGIRVFSTAKSRYEDLLYKIQKGEFNKKPAPEKKLKPVNEACLFKPVLVRDHDRDPWLTSYSLIGINPFTGDFKYKTTKSDYLNNQSAHFMAFSCVKRIENYDYGDGGNYE